MRILLAGTFCGVHAQGGATWAVAQYALGLSDLGHEIMLVEPGERCAMDTAYFDRASAALGLVGRAAIIHSDRNATGLDYHAVVDFARTCDVLLNLAGVLRDDELIGAVAKRVYIDLDPGFTQMWQAVEGVDMGFSGHDRFFTVGQAIGTERCSVPTCGLAWSPVLPPVALGAWPAITTPPRYGITTVANWRSYGSIWLEGVLYGQKAHSLRELMDLPHRVPGARFEPALAIDAREERDLRALDDNGWQTLDATQVTSSPHRYRDFVQQSLAEFGVAKSGYVNSRCGWFSDRSACYLASGRPVVAQDTDWPAYLPSGEGLIAFSDSPDAAEAFARVLGDYPRHAKAARAVATELLDARQVLGALLEEVGTAP